MCVCVFSQSQFASDVSIQAKIGIFDDLTRTSLILSLFDDCTTLKSDPRLR